MSHYSVLVVNTKGLNDVYAQLEPFSQSIELPRYEVGKVSKEEIDDFVEYYRKKEPDLLNEKSAEEIYGLKGGAWNGNQWTFRKDGTVMEYSTYNPNSKWDWYEVGGRWAAQLKLKKGVEPLCEVNFSWGWSEERKLEAQSQNKTDMAFNKDIDWEGMRDPKTFDEAQRFWELIVEEQKPQNEEDEKMITSGIYKREYYLDRYKDKTKYATAMTSFTTYAVLIDGEWIAPGDMGWFGCSSESGDEGINWDLSYYEKFIKDLPEDALITVVDCHI